MQVAPKGYWTQTLATMYMPQRRKKEAMGRDYASLGMKDVDAQNFELRTQNIQAIFAFIYISSDVKMARFHRLIATKPVVSSPPHANILMLHTNRYLCPSLPAQNQSCLCFLSVASLKSPSMVQHNTSSTASSLSCHISQEDCSSRGKHCKAKE